jgi:hypothetical protein
VAETSYLWTTNGTGDGDAGGYTQADTSLMMQIIAACCAHEGVAPGFWDELECTGGGANTVNVATGGALVDGKPYPNNAPVAVNVPSAVGAGNTRIDRIVLRANWAAQTVRITRLAGVDAASPVAPTITQTSGTTYDIQLCRVLVDTSGAVTVTDERVWAQVGATGIADGAVATEKLGDHAVDYSKAGNGVLQFTMRKGGSPTNWSTPGTTPYSVGYVRAQGGCHQLTIPAGLTTVSAGFNFPVAFSQLPLVLVSPLCSTEMVVAYGVANSATQMVIILRRAGTQGDAVTDVQWLAIGPE